MATKQSAFVVPSETFTPFDALAGGSFEERPRRSRRRALLGVLTSALVVLLAVVATSATASRRSPAAAAASVSAAPAAAQPGSADDLYDRAAATCPGLPSSILAAIHHVETRSSPTGAVSSAGALGPMQFLPSTWASYGVDADGNGRADVDDLVDAVFSAAHYLCANGGADPSHLRDALWNYNHSWDYVDRVLAVAAT